MNEIKITEEQLQSLVPQGYRLVDTSVEKWMPDGGYMWLVGEGAKWNTAINGMFWGDYPVIAPDLPPKPTPEQVATMRWAGKEVELTGEFRVPLIGELYHSVTGYTLHCYSDNETGGTSRWILRVKEPKIVCHAEGDRCHGCDHYQGKADKCVHHPDRQPKPKGRWVECKVNKKGVFYRFDLLSIAKGMRVDKAASVPGYGGTRYEGEDSFVFEPVTKPVDDGRVMCRPVAVRFWVEE